VTTTTTTENRRLLRQRVDDRLAQRKNPKSSPSAGSTATRACASRTSHKAGVGSPLRLGAVRRTSRRRPSDLLSRRTQPSPCATRATHVLGRAVQPASGRFYPVAFPRLRPRRRRDLFARITGPADSPTTGPQLDGDFAAPPTSQARGLYRAGATARSRTTSRRASASPQGHGFSPRRRRRRWIDVYVANDVDAELLWKQQEERHVVERRAVHDGLRERRTFHTQRVLLDVDADGRPPDYPRRHSVPRGAQLRRGDTRRRPRLPPPKVRRSTGRRLDVGRRPHRRVALADPPVGHRELARRLDERAVSSCIQRKAASLVPTRRDPAVPHVGASTPRPSGMPTPA